MTTTVRTEITAETTMNSAVRLALRLSLMIVMLGLIYLAYQESPENSFQFDDFPNIVDHEPVRVTQASPEAFAKAFSNPAMKRRPLPSLSFAVDWWRGGGSANAFMQTNLLLHGASALAVYWLLLLVLVPKGNSSHGWSEVCVWLGAALWALHPIQVQAVTYAVQRMTSMAALFAVLCVATYLKARLGNHRSVNWYVASALCLSLALLSKENAAVTLVLLTLAEFCLVRKPGEVLRNRFDVALVLAPAAVLSFLAGALALRLRAVSWLVSGYAYRDFTLGQRLLTQPRVFFFHISQILWPQTDRFTLSHDFQVSTGLLHPPATLWAILGLVAWLTIGLLLARRNTRLRRGGFFLLWVLAACLVEFTFIPLEMVFEHRMYLPSMGLAGLLAWVLLPTSGRGRLGLLRRAAVLVLLLLSLVTLIGVTRSRVRVWRNPVTLWSDAVQNSPGSARAHNNLGEVLWKSGDRQSALKHYDLAVQLDPEYADAAINLARAYSGLGLSQQAHEEYLQLLERFPENAKAHYSFGLFLLDLGQLEAARQQLAEAQRLDPGDRGILGFLIYVEQELDRRRQQ